MATNERKQETNWLRVCKLLIEAGSEILLDAFERAVHPKSLRQFLLEKKPQILQHIHEEILDLNNQQLRLMYYENKKKQSHEYYDELESEYRERKISKWDISLISRLLYYFSVNGMVTISKPEYDSHDKIRNLRNDLFAHYGGQNGFRMTDSDFKINWNRVKNVLTHSASFSSYNIENKIISIQKEKIVDGDTLMETFANWMQCDKKILDKLDRIENTLKQERAERRQENAEIKQLIQNQGAVATGRMLDEMHRDMDTLTSEDAEQGGNNYIMDTETLPGTSGNTGVAMTDRMMTEMHNGEEIPDEGNNSVLETQTVPASSGNIAAVGESVLADRLLEMRVNEPVESRDESASILQSNLLTEQRRHNEMPPGIGYIDCLILYAEVDRDDAVKFKKHLINDIKIKKHGPVVALLYDDPKLRSLSESKIQYLQKVFELSTYKMLYVTKNFVEAKWEIFKTEVCIVQTIENEETSWSVVPVFPQTNETFSVPIVLERLVGFHYKENDEHYKESLTSLIEDRVKIRVKRNQSLVEEQQQRADEEIVDSHPQQDAFIQTSGQTPGASAGIQETNTIAGAVATDRMLDGMHNGEETLSSQVSMDAEPDEENNSFMEPQTVPASSGNIAARGESVLADRLLEMTVNEPVGSRDESASNLQSNLLIEQLRHNVMPPEIGYIDCLILYAEVDRDNALKFKKHLINDIKIKKHGPVVALLYDDPELCSLSQRQLQYLQKVFELSTYKMLYVTKDFVEDKWENFKTDVFIVQTIENEETQWSVVPVYPQTNETFSVPDVLERLVGFHYNENDEHYKESLTNLIEARVDVRVTRNQSLIEEQQQRTDEEIADSHSQPDAFVQTSGQTTGASAEIQEANTIPGAVATDRMLHGMHRVVDTLPSELSHDAEQGGNNNIMDTETLTGTSGNTGAVGGSVLADPLRDDSLSSLQSNFLTEQEGDTLDDVDLPSSCHDDKMEQKEEAQVASLAEIKQKKKKKKKKKTRR